MGIVRQGSMNAHQIYTVIDALKPNSHFISNFLHLGSDLSLKLQHLGLQLLYLIEQLRTLIDGGYVGRRLNS